MKKKLYSLIIVITIAWLSVFSIGNNVGFAKTSADFTDLKDLDAATKAKFDAMISAGVFDGVSDTNFGLREEMNRAQFAKVAALITGLDVNKDLKTSSFSDVHADDAANGYALPYIEAIKKAGITDGVGNGNYNPAGEVTKEQLATFLVRILGNNGEAGSTPTGTDRTVSDWAQGYVAQALQLKLLSNNANGTFGGNTSATRDLLVLGGFETAKTIEGAKPLEVSGADFVAANKLQLTLTVGVNANSVDLSKITINGVPLDPKLDSYELSEDKKTIIIKLHEGFQFDPSKTPTITVNGLVSIFGNEVKNEEGKIIPVKVTEPPVNSATPVIPESAPIEPNPGEELPEVPIEPNPGEESPEVPIEPNPGGELPEVPTEPNPGEVLPEVPIEPNPGEELPEVPIEPNPGEELPEVPIEPNPGEELPEALIDLE
ncbi:S-layer homology domain-containing protein [Solibacillus sp. MA9]|uniref:S-layer homology domain-containing protein n=1 Tax=Solibacillus palustris TaxID=2908203 RepID=A0ABS9UHI6_9BACL|nr:S-layer homology domain-containing protein [Solibacillus sp. MA9]